MSSTYDPEAADEWINKVNLVQQTIKDLGSNKPNALKNADDLLSKFQSDKDNKKRKKALKTHTRAPDTPPFQKGDGWKNEYKSYCIKCFTEIMIDIKQCPRCNYTPLITRKERRHILQERVNTLKKEYELKEIRRKRWENYRKLHAKNEYNMTNYDEWELWQDELDWSEFMEPNYIPSENAAAQSMALDMKQRAAKRGAQMKAAVRSKTEGNKYLKLGSYSLAVQHYTAAINQRRDYKALYTNRALAFMKLGRYDKCISDCSIVIDMIEFIDQHERKSDIIFKAYLRRANAYQLLGKLIESKQDIERAIELRAKQKDALQLYETIKQLICDEEMREKIQTEILNDNALTNFDHALKLILDYFERTAEIKAIKSTTSTSTKKKKKVCEDVTPFDKRIHKWNAEKPSLLFHKLLTVISCKHEYAVRFADSNGLNLTFKYLESELVELHDEMHSVENDDDDSYHNNGVHVLQNKMDLNKKQITLSKCCKLLIFITSYKHNKCVIQRNKKLITLISSNIWYIMSSFERYNDVLSIDSVHLCSICCGEIKEVRDYIASNDTYCKLFYKNINEYLLYSPPNNNKLQILQYLFDFVEALFGAPSFIKMSVAQARNKDASDHEEEHLYVAMFNHFTQNMDYVHSARMGQDEMMKFEIKQAVISSILTALATLFGPNRSVVDILMKDPLLNERISILKTHLIALNRMFIQFEQRNPMKNLAALPQGPMAIQAMQAMQMSAEQTQQVMSKLYEKHQLNISQICKVITVFMSLSHHHVMHKTLIALEIHEILFDLLPFVRFIDYKNTKHATILSLARDHIVNYFDQMSAHPHFDVIVAKYNKECGYPPNQKEALPAFWTFISEIIMRRSFIMKEQQQNINHNNKSSQQQQQHRKHYKNNKKHYKKYKKHKKYKKQKNTQTNGNNVHKKDEKEKEEEENYDEMEVDAQSGCIRILTRWIRRRLPDDKSNNNNNNSDDDEEDEDVKKHNGKVLKYLAMEISTEDNRIIDTFLVKHYNAIFKYIKFCRDPHVLANAPLLLKQFIIYAKLNEKNKPHLAKLVKRHSKNKLKDLMALFTNEHVSIIQNAVTCMAQLATFDDDLRNKIREMGGMKAMSQLHMQHRQSLFK